MIDDIDKAIMLFKSAGNEYTFEKICQYDEDEKKHYKELLKKFKNTNSSKTASTSEKGDSLEEIASFVLKSGNVFEVYDNMRTTTNELDQLVRTTVHGSILCSHGILNPKLKNFIGECKNYKTKVSVTYVGKICGLLNTTSNKICILFSYNGVTGKGWRDASGLIKKFYLSKENVDERYCIIDFNIKDFESIEHGNNFLQIIEDKIFALKNDTDCTSFLKSHEATNFVNSNTTAD